MINRIIQFSISNKLIVFLLTLSIVGFGVYAVLNIPLGAVPDITNNQVQVITTSNNLSTQDVEQFITYPVELEMSNLPGVIEIRSISKFGLSVVTIVFDDKMGTYLPRQLIAEKIKSAAASIPEGFGTPEMGPISTGLGEIYQYFLDTRPEYKDAYSIMELRTIQDWVVKRQLAGIPGVVEVNTWGGFLKQYEIALNPEQLKAMDITLLEVYDAVEANNSVAGGAYIEKQNKSFFIRGDGLVKNTDDIEQIVVANRNANPVRISDIGEVRFGFANRFGAITANGEGEKVMGQIMMLKDANSNKVIRAVKERVAEVQESLPEGIFINPIVDRSELIGRTSFTVFENLILGSLIVFIMIVLLLGNLRSGLIIGSIIPLSLLFTISMMYIFGIDANLMSLGALDFGIIIDGAVIIVEFLVVRFTLNRGKLDEVAPSDRQSLRDRVTFEGATKMMNSAIFGQVIILIVFIPVLSLSGVEGKMFRPMALSFSFALLGAMFFGFTWLPAVSALFLKPEQNKQWRITKFIMGVMHRSYAPVIRWSYDHKGVIIGLAIASLVMTGWIFSRMGGEFVPTLDEGDFVIQPVLKTGTSLSKTVELTTQMEQILMEDFPEVDQIVCRIGAAEVPTDPMSMEEIDMIITLHPRKTWTSASSKEELADLFKDSLQVIPGIDYEFTQPIEMRFNELITGVRADLAIKIFGEDLEILADKAEEVTALISDIPGAADVVYEKTEGLPQMSVRYDRNKLAYYGLSAREMNQYLTTAFGGGIAGVVFEGERRFDMAVRLLPEYRNNIDHLRNLPVRIPGGNQIPLWEVASIEYTTGPAKISRDEGRRRVVVSVNVRNRDLESVVSDIEQRLNASLELPPGYYIDYGGQFENLQNASSRLKLAVPVALLLIFIFLHFAFGSIKEAALVFTAVPLSIVGGVFFLWIRGMPFSISAGIGFIALFGIAVLNGIVLIEHLKDLKNQGIEDMRERVLKGTKERLRPVLLTASAAAMGFLPMAISTSAGAEVQRPLATVVIGGLVTSTLLTMLLLPILYAMVDRFDEKRFRIKRVRKSALAVLFLVGIATSGMAQDREQITLQEAISMASSNNPELMARKLQSEQAAVLVGTSFSIDRTSLFYNYDQNNIADNGFPIGVIGVEQSMDFPGVYLAERKVKLVEEKMSQDLVDLQQIKLENRLSIIYLNLQYLLRKEQLVQELDSLYDASRVRAKTSYEQGNVSALNYLTIKSASEEMKVERARIQSELQAQEHSFSTLLDNDSVLYLPSESLSAWAFDSASTIPGYDYRKHQLEKAHLAVKLEKNRLFPGLSLGYFSGTNNYPASRNYQGFDVGLEIPLFFGAQKSKIKASKLGRDALSYSLKSYEQELNRYSFSIARALESQIDRIVYYEQQGLSLSDALLREAEVSYRTGEIDFFRYSKLLEDAISIKLQYLDALYRHNLLLLKERYPDLYDEQ